MKKNLFVFFSIMIMHFGITFGQELNSNKNYIGINLFSIRYVSEPYVKEGFVKSFPSGLILKHDYQNFSLRGFFNFNKSSSEYSDPPYVSDGMSEFKHYSMFTLGTGIQKNIDFKKLRFFYGLDMFSTFSIYKYQLYGGIAGFKINNDYYHVWLGFAPVAGFQFKIINRVFLTFESNYSLAYRIKNSDDEFVSAKCSTFQSYCNPINNLSISYNF